MILPSAPGVPQPFIDEGQPVLAAFPDDAVLYAPLSCAIVSGIAAILGYVGLLMLREPQQQPGAPRAKQD